MQRKLFFLLFGVFSLSFLYSSAQQNRFVYIQTENKQPFYVKLEKKVFSSSASGYLIIPKLKDGEYAVVVGFPKSEWAEQQFNCTIDKKDIGFLLKDFGDKGWGLFNFQSLEILLAGNNGTVKKTETAITNADDFSDKLSKVVNDPTIKQTKVVPVETVVVKKEVPKPAETEKQPDPVTKAVTTEPSEVKIEEVAKSVIIKSLSNTNAAGTEMVYLDGKNGNQDTIRIFIPADTINDPIATATEKQTEAIKPVAEVIKTEEKIVTPVSISEDEIKTEVKAEAKKAGDEKFLDVELPRATETKDSAVSAITTPEVIQEPAKDIALETGSSSVKLTNSNCKADASDEDFLKLRKKMASAKDDDDMISLAKKAFKSKCFTTQQIKNLAVLFLNDGGKYQFFDAAYQFVSDAKNFASLESSLTDAYYINRFKVMINH